MKGCQFDGVDELQAEAHEQEDHDELDRDDDGVDESRLRDAAVAERGDCGRDRDRRQIDQRAGWNQAPVNHVQGRRRERSRQRKRHADAMTDGVQQAGEISGPADRHRRGGKRVLEHEHPADEPGHELAERRVGIGIGAARDRQHRGEFGIAEAGEPAGEAGDHERQYDRRAGVGRGGMAGQHEDAGADDRADAERHEVPRGQHALQRMLAARGIGFRLGLDRLRAKQVHACSPRQKPTGTLTQP